jgi:hypothetical protein
VVVDRLCFDNLNTNICPLPIQIWGFYEERHPLAINLSSSVSLVGLNHHAPQHASSRLGRPPWSTALAGVSGSGAPSHQGTTSGRLRHAKTGSAAHVAAGSNGAVNRASHIPDTAMKETAAAVERALRPSRTGSVPERTHMLS